MAFKKFKPGPVTAAAVKAARSDAKLTQAAAAELVHSSVRSWQKWEQGEREMPLATFELFLIKARLGEWFEYVASVET